MKYRLDWDVRQNLGDRTGFSSRSEEFNTIEEAQQHFLNLCQRNDPDYIEYYNFSLFKYEDITNELQK